LLYLWKIGTRTEKEKNVEKPNKPKKSICRKFAQIDADFKTKNNIHHLHPPPFHLFGKFKENGDVPMLFDIVFKKEALGEGEMPLLKSFEFCLLNPRKFALICGPTVVFRINGLCIYLTWCPSCLGGSNCFVF
jgi:hypothetical protein